MMGGPESIDFSFRTADVPVAYERRKIPTIAQRLRYNYSLGRIYSGRASERTPDPGAWLRHPRTMELCKDSSALSQQMMLHFGVGDASAALTLIASWPVST